MYGLSEAELEVFFVLLETRDAKRPEEREKGMGGIVGAKMYEKDPPGFSKRGMSQFGARSRWEGKWPYSYSGQWFTQARPPLWLVGETRTRHAVRIVVVRMRGRRPGEKGGEDLSMRFRPAAESRLMSAAGDWPRRDKLQRLLRHGARGPVHPKEQASSASTCRPWIECSDLKEFLS
ncbi:hypothetical protein LX32DRAFT_206804 [Colletotrichum zoysiae]|uniref:Uncharacterized protein n=1 Tax=Colletotrichum zoysiae TaxID=1216348 RepID=A0AAD9HQK6_9PEZI|nr:hypothetical protein LX32DRAFT_206804 [Colletotrichum zoysiae]